MYDIIGDIHGHAEALKKLLHKMDYKEIDHVWQHSTRKVVFVGDYIDRGPAIRETLQIVRRMVEHDKAIALMGNHEFNALAYSYELEEGTYLRSHIEKHNRQHSETLQQFANYPDEWEDYLNWFYTLPLFLEQDGIRAVHACWDDEHMQWLNTHGHQTLNEELLIKSHQWGTKEYEVIEDILKGKEIDIPEEFAWPDKDGNTRVKNRIRWWVDPAGVTHGSFLFDCPEPLHSKLVESAPRINIYPADAPPVFIGHYWLNDSKPFIQSHNVICLDYSIAKNGALVAYRWSGEEEIDNKHFVSVKYGDPDFIV